MIVDERRHMADLLAGLDTEQLNTQSLCDEWTVHEVAGHLISFLYLGQVKIYIGIFACLGNFDPANQFMARLEARRSSEDIIRILRSRSESKVTIPRSGYDPLLADIVLHDLDIRIPLNLSRTIPEERLWVAFNHLTTAPSPGFAMGSRLEGLRFESTDTGWATGRGALVRGSAEALVLAASGRTVAFDQLEGDGVELLQERVVSRPRIKVSRRMAKVLGLVISPSDRKSKEVEPPPVAVED
jgi:uncharacterized protein (TIGR03083 family)